MKLDNPAARLLMILEKGLEIQDEMNCRKAWCKLLDVQPGGNAILMGRIGKVMSLSTDILESLNNIGGVKVDRYLHWVTPVEQAFIQNDLNGAWKGFKGQINDHVINYLSMTSDLLSHKCPEPILSDSSLESILKNARSLIDEIRESDLPSKIKEFMVKHLYKVCLAVEEHSISGAESVSNAVESAFGYGVLHGDSVELAKTNSVAKKFWQQMANVALIVSISTGVQQLAPPIMKLLPEISFEESTIQEDPEATSGKVENMDTQR
ncbi:hypothetical protein [Shewanella algae]|uniref:hypothetical protein n=1 Tax=Shewanella algae TaxID=38313 RepID=UPI0025565B2A|nr:hypothetical protein [Shewanella algae]MDL2195283.1 hypothetical protein [Shewanella algae]